MFGTPSATKAGENVNVFLFTITEQTEQKDQELFIYGTELPDGNSHCEHIGQPFLYVTADMVHMAQTQIF